MWVGLVVVLAKRWLVGVFLALNLVEETDSNALLNNTRSQSSKIKHVSVEDETEEHQDTPVVQ